MTTQNADIAPWECQEGETSKAYEAFVLYRDAGPTRTHPIVCAQLGKSRACVSRWAAEHNWTERIRAWDSMPVRAVVAAYEAMAADIAEQHRALADKLMQRLSQSLDLLPEGADPSLRWSTAAGAARQSHSLAVDLSKPKDVTRDETRLQITALIERLTGE